MLLLKVCQLTYTNNMGFLTVIQNLVGPLTLHFPWKILFMNCPVMHIILLVTGGGGGGGGGL